MYPRLTWWRISRSLCVRPTDAAFDFLLMYHSRTTESSSLRSSCVLSESFFISFINSLSSCRIWRWSLQCFRSEPTRAALGRNLCHFCPVLSMTVHELTTGTSSEQLGHSDFSFSFQHLKRKDLIRLW